MKEYNRKFNNKRSAFKSEKMFSNNTRSYASHDSDQFSVNQVNDQSSVRSVNTRNKYIIILIIWK